MYNLIEINYYYSITNHLMLNHSTHLLYTSRESRTLVTFFHLRHHTHELAHSHSLTPSSIHPSEIGILIIHESRIPPPPSISYLILQSVFSTYWDPVHCSMRAVVHTSTIRIYVVHHEGVGKYLGKT